MLAFSKKTAVAVVCAAALGGLSTTPSVAGVIAPTDKATVEADSPLEFVGWRRICHYRCVRPVRHYGWCHHRHYYPDYYVVSPAYVVAYPAYYVTAGWGWGWGWGFPWFW